MMRIKLIQGEAKPVTLKVTEKGKPVPIPPEAILLLGVKKNKEDGAYVFTVENAEFNRSQADRGILSFYATPEHTNNAPGVYVAQLKITFTPGPPEETEKTDPFEIEIEKAIVT
jgi:hypothetical protein